MQFFRAAEEKRAGIHCFFKVAHFVLHLQSPRKWYPCFWGFVLERNLICPFGRKSDTWSVPGRGRCLCPGYGDIRESISGASPDRLFSLPIHDCQAFLEFRDERIVTFLASHGSHLLALRWWLFWPLRFLSRCFLSCFYHCHHVHQWLRQADTCMGNGFQEMVDQVTWIRTPSRNFRMYSLQANMDGGNLLSVKVLPKTNLSLPWLIWNRHIFKWVYESYSPFIYR